MTTAKTSSSLASVSLSDTLEAKGEN